MMKYNSKIFARSICAVMAGIMMVGGLTGCGNDDAVDGRGMRLEKQNGDKTEITGIAEKYREKESKQKKKSLQDNGLSGIFNSMSNDVMYAEEACDVATVAGDAAMVTDTSNSMYTEIAYDTREYDSVAENGFVSTADSYLAAIVLIHVAHTVVYCIFQDWLHDKFNCTIVIYLFVYDKFCSKSFFISYLLYVHVTRAVLDLVRYPYDSSAL
jgi:hypothetical protein